MTEVDGCQACEGANRVTWMLTHLTPPATIQSCEQDIDVALITLLSTRHDVPAGWLYEVFEQALKTAVAEQEAEAKAAAAPKRRTKAAKEPTPIPEEVTDDE